MERSHLSNPLKRLAAAATDWLIDHSLRRQFRTIHLFECDRPPADSSFILFANHHYWWDGYLTYFLKRPWSVDRFLVWMREWRRFPPFGLLGAMPFPDDDMQTRMRTIRRTIRTLQNRRAMLILFPERDLHPAPDILPFERGTVWLHRRMPEVPLLPLAIEIVQGIHEFPQVWMATGEFFQCEESDDATWLECARKTIEDLLKDLQKRRRQDPDSFRTILQGRLSANERW